MKFLKGRYLRTQPKNLRYVLRCRRESETGKRLRDQRSEVNQFCDENFGTPTKTLVPVGCVQHWWWDLGTEYVYYFFETKKDAEFFKLRWG